LNALTRPETEAFQPPALQQPYGIESAATAAASKAKALVEARYIMAMRNPRNWDQVRQDLLKECRRPTFADNKSAYYVKPIGDGVEGLGIRFVEVAIRCMKNISVDTEMTYEDDTKEVHRVEVTDLESNVPLGASVPVSKSVERSRPSDDGSYISVRKNSWGKNVYLVPAKGDELLNIRGALISKQMRTLGLRLIPGYLQDEAIDIIKAVRLDKAAQDPDAERRKILDAFAEIGVKAVDLTAYLGHDIATCSPAEMVKLRGLYGAIRDGEATWATVMENKAEQDGSGPPRGGATEPTTMSAEAFDKKKAGWKALIVDGKKTVADLLAMVQTKDRLSQDQQMEIASWKVSTSAEDQS
jgi:hypothetical protein